MEFVEVSLLEHKHCFRLHGVLLVGLGEGPGCVYAAFLSSVVRLSPRGLVSVFLIHASLLLAWLREQVKMPGSLLFVNLTLDNQKLDLISQHEHLYD